LLGASLRFGSTLWHQCFSAVTAKTPLILSCPCARQRCIPSAATKFIADLQEDWEKYGTQILELMREKFPDLYFASIVKLAQIVRIEADVSLKEPKPKTIEEVLQRVVSAASRSVVW
jgi:hypothetical protein